MRTSMSGCAASAANPSFRARVEVVDQQANAYAAIRGLEQD
jgi:hypothetical protein